MKAMNYTLEENGLPPQKEKTEALKTAQSEMY